MFKPSAEGATERADSQTAPSLVPTSLNPTSLNPTSLNPTSLSPTSLSPTSVTASSPLEPLLAAVEGRLAALGEALRTRDPAGIDRQAGELQRALAAAVDTFARAAHRGEVTPAWRARLAMAGAQMAAQRESLARATAALDRAIDVLLPAEGSTLYSTHGSPLRPARSGAAQA